MVEGRLMLSRGLQLESGFEIDAIDAPVLGIKLLAMVLGRVFPQGPEEIAGTRRIDYTGRTGIKFATPSAGGYVAAPWSVKGEVRKGDDGVVGFDLMLSFPVRQAKENEAPFMMMLVGRLGMRKGPVLPDSESLAGWTTYGIGPQRYEQAQATIYDYGATPENHTGFKTVGDIRAFLAAQDHPGAPDPSRDFTGFWKERCGQDFGFQILHRGDEGKYAVVFCGPGGCGDPAEARLTYITGDRRYQVVSDDELVQISRSGERTTYHRCTRERHPALTSGD